MVSDDLDVLTVFNHPQGAYLLPAPNAADQLQLITGRSFIGKPVPLHGPKAHLPCCFLRQTFIYACTGDSDGTIFKLPFGAAVTRPDSISFLMAAVMEPRWMPFYNVYQVIGKVKPVYAAKNHQR